MIRPRSRVILLCLLLALLMPAGGAAAQDDPPVKIGNRPVSNKRKTDPSASVVQIVTVGCDTAPPAPDDATLGEFPGDCDESTAFAWSGTVIDESGLILTSAEATRVQSTGDLGWMFLGMTEKGGDVPEFSMIGQAVAIDDDLALAVVLPVYTIDGTELGEGDVTLAPIRIETAGSVGPDDAVTLYGYSVDGEQTELAQVDASVLDVIPDANVTALGDTGWIQTDAEYGGSVAGGLALNAKGRMVGVPSLFNLDADAGTFDAGYLRPAAESLSILAGDESAPSETPAAEPTDAPATKPAKKPSGKAGIKEPKVPKGPPEDAGVIITGNLLSADTGVGIEGGLFVVLQPGVAIADFDPDNPDQIYTVGVSSGDQGAFQTLTGVQRDESYSIIVVAEGYDPAAEDGVVLATADSPDVVDLGTIQMAVSQ